MERAKETRLIWVLAAVQLMHIMDFMIMMPLGPELMRVFSIDALQFGALVSTYTAASAAACLISALILDHYDRRSALLFSFVLFAVATLGCALAQSYWQLMTARFLAGFFGGTIGVLVQTIVADVVPFERRGNAMAKLMSAFSAATAAGVPLGLVSANIWGWHAPFFALALASSIVWLLMYLTVPPMSSHRKHQQYQNALWSNLWQVLSTRRYFLGYAFTFFMVCTGFIVIPFVTLHLQGNVGLSAEQIPILYFVAGIATLVTAPLIGKLSDRVGKVQMFSGLALAATVPVYLLTHMQPQNFSWVLATTTLFFVVVSGRMIPAMAIVSEVPHARQRGAYMSLNTAVQSAAMALAAFVGGWLTSGESGQLQNYAANGYVSIASNLISIGLLWLVFMSVTRTRDVGNEASSLG